MSAFDGGGGNCLEAPDRPSATASADWLSRLDVWRTSLGWLGPTTYDKVSSGGLVRESFRSGLERILSADTTLRLSPRPAAVHSARVATRRLRSSLRTFRPLLQAEWLLPIREELGWLAALLGAVRDLDVLQDSVETLAAQLEGGERAMLGVLVEELSGRRQVAQAELGLALSSERYFNLVSSLFDALSVLPLLPGASRTGRRLAADLVEPSWRRLVRRVSSLPNSPDDRALHELRIRAKELRYACEAVAPVAPPPARELGRRAKELQSVLGRHHDAVVLRGYLRQVVSRSWQHGYAGGLCLVLSLRQDDVESWRRSWSALEKDRLSSWLG